MTDPLFPRLADPDDAEAIRFPDRVLTYAELAGAAAAVAERAAGSSRVAVWAENEPEVCVAVLGALAAGVAIVPINPANGSRELEHIASDSRPDLLFARPGAEIAPELGAIERVEVDPTAGGGALPDRLRGARTRPSSSTRPARPGRRRACRSRAARSPRTSTRSPTAWAWTGDDLSRTRCRSSTCTAWCSACSARCAAAAASSTSARFDRRRRRRRAAPRRDDAVRRADDVPPARRRGGGGRPRSPRAFARARLLVSGSAALPAVDHERIERLTGQRIVERYGMTETLMNAAVRADGERRPGYVGLPLPGVEVRLVDDDGDAIDASDDETIGEIQVRGPNLFPGYLNRPDATAEALDGDGWFRTGDLATRAPDGYIRIVGRRATDLIKSGGFKIGAGEIEGALLEHPGGRRGRGRRRARRRPRRADRGLGRARRRARRGGEELDRPRRPRCSRRTSARARCTSSTSCRATRWARS